MIPIWQSAIMIVLFLSCISVGMQAYGNRANQIEHAKTALLLKQNEELSTQIDVLQHDISQLTSEMNRVIEENNILKQEVNALTNEVGRLQERFNCNPLLCGYEPVRFK